jgi:hypothetical protein
MGPRDSRPRAFRPRGGANAAHFQLIKPWLMGDAARVSQAAAARLGLSEGEVKVA